jgi:hypothetical protein
VIGTLVVVLLIVAAGARLADEVKLRQQKVVLSKLPLPEAHGYYELLRGRVRRVRLLRAIALLAVLALGYAYRRSLAGAPPRAAVPASRF